MAQFLTLLSVLLLFAVFNPIVCPTSSMFSGRRDRAPYIQSNEYSPQHLGDTAGSIGSRLRKVTAQNRQQSSSQGYNSPISNQQDTTDSIVDKNIRSVFSTNFGPGLHLFDNISPIANKPHFTSPNDQMVGDQPHPYPPPSSSSSISKPFFKVQRGPDGELTLVYNEDFKPNVEREKSQPAAADWQNSGSHKETRFQTHFPGGVPLKKDKPAASLPTVDHTSSKDGSLEFPNEVDIKDCLENDDTKNDKVFCSHLRHYPEKNHLENLIKEKLPNLELFFGEDLVLPQNISQRMNNAPNEEYLCKSRVRLIFPQSGLNTEYNWLYIVNSPNYKQGIRIEECLEPDTPCGQDNGLSLPNRYTATCEQSYIYRSLIAYKNETIVKDTFRVPSCCKCVLRSN